MLTPRPWPLGQGDPPDPPPWLADALAAAAPAPLLLLVERRLAPLAASQRRRLAASLSTAEHGRLAALRRQDDQERFLLGRAALRLVLASWLGCEPAAVSIGCGDHGKPFCPDGPQFNLSHSGALILLALHADRPVGVDVEQQRAGLDWPAIAARVLTAAERRALAQLPAPQQPAAFLQAWCRLEAQLKARGTGFAGLEALRRQQRSGNGHRSEQLWSLVLPEGYVGSAACGPGPPLP